MKNRDVIVEQYRAGRLVRTFEPTEDPTRPWRMRTNGKTYPRTHGWVLSKILPTLMVDSPITTRVVPIAAPPKPS